MPCCDWSAHLAGAALGGGAAQRARQLRHGVLGALRPAAGLQAVLHQSEVSINKSRDPLQPIPAHLLPAAVALLALLHHSITANGNLRLCKCHFN